MRGREFESEREQGHLKRGLFGTSYGQRDKIT